MPDVVMTRLAVAAPELFAFRSKTSALLEGVKTYFAIGRVEIGRSEWWGRGRRWQSGPGSVQVKEPGDVHRDIARDGEMTWTVVVLPTDEVARGREAGKVVSQAQLEANDERAAPFHRLHDAVVAGADRLTLDVAMAESIGQLARLRDHSEHSRPVRRAVDYLRGRIAESVTLEELAHYAGLDKFHLCRAFRAQIGMPPHTYLTHLRVQEAARLLRGGARASELAPQVGIYDQSQLTRHFRRIVGTTPARYANANRKRSVAR